MKEKLIELFEYNFHVNNKLVDFVTDNFQVTPEKTKQLLNHLINAQQIWNARINSENEFEVWQINNWNSIRKINNDNYFKTVEIIRSREPEDIIEYKNSKGQKYSNKIEDILLHIINHSTYHRAQIATDIKEQGIEPLNTDYIFYKRKIEVYELLIRKFCNKV